MFISKFLFLNFMSIDLEQIANSIQRVPPVEELDMNDPNYYRKVESGLYQLKRATAKANQQSVQILRRYAFASREFFNKIGAEVIGEEEHPFIGFYPVYKKDPVLENFFEDVPVFLEIKRKEDADALDLVMQPLSALRQGYIDAATNLVAVEPKIRIDPTLKTLALFLQLGETINYAARITFQKNNQISARFVRLPREYTMTEFVSGFGQNPGFNIFVAYSPISSLDQETAIDAAITKCEERIYKSQPMIVELVGKPN